MRAKAYMIVIVLTVVGYVLCAAPLTSAASEVENGKKAPDFEYTDVDGNSGKLSDHEGSYVVLEWFNHGCPFVRKHYESGKMQSLQKEFTNKGVVWIAVNSTSDAHGDYQSAEDTKKKAAEEATAASIIVLDPEGTIGKLYGAKTTPHIFIIDPGGTLIYQGAADSVKSTDVADIPNATNYIQAGLTEAMSGKELTTAETKAYGCSVKYK